MSEPLQIIMTIQLRVATKISSYKVYVVGSWGTEQPGSPFGLIFLLFPTKNNQ